MKSGGVGALDFTNASIFGKIEVQGTDGVPYGLATIIVAPAGTAPPQEQQSTCTSNPTTGTFICDANAGWNSVTVTAPLYLENFTWVNVPSASSSAPRRHHLHDPPDDDPRSGRHGFGSRHPAGLGAVLRDRDADERHVPEPRNDRDAPTRTASTRGLVPPYPLPRGDYKLIFTATGFTSNWTWVNATVPGGVINASTVTLYSLGSAASPALAQRAAASGPPSSADYLSEWAVGNVLDNTTGLPVEGMTMQWQQLRRSRHHRRVDGHEQPRRLQHVGHFRADLLQLQCDRLPTRTRSITNVTGLDEDGVDFLPTVHMQPETFVTGRVEIGPSNWTWLSTAGRPRPGADRDHGVHAAAGLRPGLLSPMRVGSSTSAPPRPPGSSSSSRSAPRRPRRGPSRASSPRTTVTSTSLGSPP